FLAQTDAIRRAALEEIPATGDPDAAEASAIAATHEDAETARAVLYAMTIARPEVAEPTLAEALVDDRSEVRQAAAEAITRRPPASAAGPLAERLAEVLGKETEPMVLQHLLAAAARAGDER